MRQLKITDIPRRDCPFGHRLEPGDLHCNGAGINALGYDVIGEDSEDFALRLAEVNGVDFDDITVATPTNPKLPNYVPTIPKGSGKLFRGYTPEVVAVSLKDVVSGAQLKVVPDIHARLGVPKRTKVILLGFAKDRLLELAWPLAERRRIEAEIAKLDLYAVIPPNYSIWDDQPHAERLINQKRSMIVYKELADMGMPAIPHIYWCGRKDLDEYVRFLERHPGINTIAIDMQTLGKEVDWQRAVTELSYFTRKIRKDMRCIIVGPSTPARIQQIIRTLPNVTIVNGSAAQAAVRRMVLEDDLKKELVVNAEKTDLMRTNDIVQKKVIDQAFKQLSRSAPATRKTRLQLVSSA